MKILLIIALLAVSSSNHCKQFTENFLKYYSDNTLPADTAIREAVGLSDREFNLNTPLTQCNRENLELVKLTLRPNIGNPLLLTIGVCYFKDCDADMLLQMSEALFDSVESFGLNRERLRLATVSKPNQVASDLRDTFSGFRLIAASMAAIWLSTVLLLNFSSVGSKKLRDAFNLKQNFLYLFKVTRGDLSFINGFKAFGMFQVVVCHFFYFGGGIGYRDPSKVGFLHQDWYFPLLFFNMYSVDMFLLITGFLSGIKLTKLTEKLKSAKFGFILPLMRALAMLPMQLVTIIVIPAFLSEYSNDASLAFLSDSMKGCTEVWWKNLLFLQSIAPSISICNPHSWYVSNDMWYFLFLCIIIFSLKTRETRNKAVVFVCVISTVFSIALNYLFAFPHFDLERGAGMTGMSIFSYHILPLSRAQPYFIGYLVSQIYLSKDSKESDVFAWTARVIRNNKIIARLLGFIAYLILFGLFSVLVISNKYSMPEAYHIFLNSYSKVLYSTALSILIGNAFLRGDTLVNLSLDSSYLRSLYTFMSKIGLSYFISHYYLEMAFVAGYYSSPVINAPFILGGTLLFIPILAVISVFFTICVDRPVMLMLS